MNQSIFTVKRITLAAVVLIILVGLLFILSFSWLTISSASSDEIFVTVTNNSTSKSQQFSLKGDSKRLMLPRGDYTVDISGSNDSIASYQKSLGILHTKLSAELIKQKSSLLLGKSELPCASQPEDKLVLFYSCGGGNASIINSSRQSVEVSEEDKINDFSGTLKNYGDDFIEARVFDNTLHVNLRDDRGYKTQDSPIKISGFSGKVTNDNFSVSSYGNFSIFDTASNTMLLFKDAKDTNPSKIKIEDKKLDTRIFSIRVLTSKNHTFLVNAKNSGDLDDHESELEEHPEPSTEAKIIVISNQQKSIVKEQEIPEDWPIRETASNPGDTVLFLLSGNYEGKAYSYTVDSGLQQQGVIPQGIQHACWKDNDSFYYSADSGKVIYLYSISKRASFLVYRNEANIISKINCLNDRLYFALENDMDTDINKFYHYMLGNKDQIGTRLDAVLPLYRTISRDTFRLDEIRDGLSVALEYDSNKNGPAPKTTVKKELVKLLEGKGVDSEKVNMIFAF